MSASGRVIRYLTRGEIEAFFREIKSVRDRAIFRLTYHRGLRASEVALLQLGDWDQREGVLLVHRLKGSKSAPYTLLPVEATALFDALDAADAMAAHRVIGFLLGSGRRNGG